MREFAKGEAVIREGDPGDALFLIMEGEMAVIKDMGKEQELVLDRIGKDVFSGKWPYWMATLARLPIELSRKRSFLCSMVKTSSESWRITLPYL